MASFGTRVTGAMRLQAGAFEDVEHDRTATRQAVLVVALAGVASVVPLIGAPSHALPLMISGILVRLLGWVIAALALLVVGTRMFPTPETEADLGQLLRTSGFAQAPGLLGFFAAVPLLGQIVPLLVALWILVAMVVAVRQALDYRDTARALLVCGVAWFILVLVTAVGSWLSLGAARA